MKIAALWCPVELATVPREHYAHDECLDPPAPVDWLAAILQEVEGDTEHAGNRFTATRLTSCPRSIAIQDNVPVTVNLMSFNNMMHGIAGHEFVAKRTRFAYGETRLHGKLFAGTPSEIEISGKPDKITPAVDVIDDYKFHGADQQRFKYEDTQKGVCDEDWRVQFSVYKMLIEQNIAGAHIERAFAWNGAMVGARSAAPAWFKTSIPFLSEEQILKLHPLGGTASVAENIAVSKVFHKRLEAISEQGDARQAAVEVAISDMPLSGQSMGWRTKKGGFISKCDYCTVRKDCDRLAGTVRV